MGGSYEMVLWKLKETRQCPRQYQEFKIEAGHGSATM